MAAVAHASPADMRRLATVRIGSYVPPAPERTPAVVYRRRRMVAVLVAASLFTVLVLAVGGLVGSSGSTGAAVAERPISPAAVYVVQPGDTFWDIARRLEPSSDPRPLVARLVAAHGSPVLVAGERLALPAA
ncbi:MAG: LysM peptidoglycan-binding domain-containing protein [Actinomycetota bacterium]|nr:LysM peptidoglycan-binding domain-containing protein [Actinomycetota bacterium]